MHDAGGRERQQRRVENPATVASEPVKTTTRNEIGSPIGTVIAIACSTVPLRTPRRMLALLKAKVAADKRDEPSEHPAFSLRFLALWAGA